MGHNRTEIPSNCQSPHIDRKPGLEPKRRELAKGETVFSCLPFVHLPLTSARPCCWSCLSPTSILSCPSCSCASYCSSSCLSADPLHPLECGLAPDLLELSDLGHLTARLLLLLATQQVNCSTSYSYLLLLPILQGGQPEQLPYDQGTRTFWDLLSHAQQIPEEDEYMVKIFTQLTRILGRDMVGDWVHFTEVLLLPLLLPLLLHLLLHNLHLQVLGRLLVNSFEVRSREAGPLLFHPWLLPLLL